MTVLKDLGPDPTAKGWSCRHDYSGWSADSTMYRPPLFVARFTLTGRLISDSIAVGVDTWLGIAELAAICAGQRRVTPRLTPDGALTFEGPCHYRRYGDYICLKSWEGDLPCAVSAATPAG
jgi:hypothetical protein